MLILVSIVSPGEPEPPPPEPEEEVEEEVKEEEQETTPSAPPPESIEEVTLDTSNNFPAIWSEEGKYLASVLGDALVKGLSLVSQERPHDPVEYLANFLRKYKDGDDEEAEQTEAPVIAAAAPIVPPPDTEQPEPPQKEEKVEEQDESPPKEQETEMIEKEEEQKNETELNEELNEGYDALEEALDEEEASTPFDPQKDEQAEQALLQMSGSGDVVEDQDPASQPQMHNSTRDENGQSVLHFACTRPGGASTILAFLQNPSVNLAWRDVNLRTARDIASNLNRAENVRVIDGWVVSLAQRGDKETLETLLIDGYDHLADVEDPTGTHIVDVAEAAGHREAALLLRGVPEFRERVERVHRCVRSGDIDGVKSLVGEDRRVAYGLNPKTGRNALHVAVLCEEVGIVKWLAENIVECVKRGDNLERTCLHYAMGVDKVEKIVRVLVRAGAKRVVKDLRDRQPSWYFINKDEIGQLQAEERAIVN